MTAIEGNLADCATALKRHNDLVGYHDPLKCWCITSQIFDLTEFIKTLDEPVRTAILFIMAQTLKDLRAFDK